MSSIKKAIIIGSGSMGTYLAERLKKRNINVHMLGRSKKSSLQKLLSGFKPDAVFLTISTLDKGEAARDYMLTCAKAKIPIITCEKGALAYHARVLKPYLQYIGYSAAVGGGTRMLPFIKQRINYDTPMEIEVVINGTLNFIFDSLCSTNSTMEDICAQAIERKYVEPGATNPWEIIRGEHRDLLMKMCVLFNVAIAQKEVIHPDQFGSFSFTDAMINNLCKVGKDYRMVVTLSNYGFPPDNLVFGARRGVYNKEGWDIEAAYRLITHTSELLSWLPEGVNNAAHLTQGEDTYTIAGPGAGLHATTGAMITDMEQLCR